MFTINQQNRLTLIYIGYNIIGRRQTPALAGMGHGKILQMVISVQQSNINNHLPVKSCKIILGTMGKATDNLGQIGIRNAVMILHPDEGSETQQGGRPGDF